MSCTFSNDTDITEGLAFIIQNFDVQASATNRMMACCRSLRENPNEIQRKVIKCFELERFTHLSVSNSAYVLVQRNQYFSFENSFRIFGSNDFSRLNSGENNPFLTNFILHSS